MREGSFSVKNFDGDSGIPDEEEYSGLRKVKKKP
jgi:hypothetical protein